MCDKLMLTCTRPPLALSHTRIDIDWSNRPSRGRIDFITQIDRTKTKGLVDPPIMC